MHQTVFKKLLAVLSGHSSYWPTLNVVVTTTVNPTCARLISGIYNTARLMGGAVGAAKLRYLVGGAMRALIGLMRVGVLLIVEVHDWCRGGHAALYQRMMQGQHAESI